MSKSIVSQAFGATDLNVDGWKICEIAKNGTDVWTGGVLCRLQIGAEQAGEPSSVEERIDALIGLERRTGQAKVDPWTEQHDGGRSGSVECRSQLRTAERA